MMEHNGAAARLAMLAGLVLAAPGSALAQAAVPTPTVAPQYGYLPPKILTRGTASSLPAGNATVIIKVFVKKDGTAQVQNIIKSSNHDFDAAALEIAKSSTYKPASNNHKPVDAFYDYTLKFAGGNASTGAPAGLAAYQRMITGNPPDYAGAKSGLESYLNDHPGDTAALSYLGVADYYLNDYEGSSEAFSKVGSKLESTYRPLASSAYAQGAIKESSAKNYDKSIAYAKAAVAIDPSYANYNVLGLTEFYAQSYPDAIASLTKARSLAESANAPGDKRASIEVNLVSAYLGAGQADQAKASAAAATRLNPKASAAVDSAFENFYIAQAVGFTNAQKFSDAANSFELGAAAAPAAAKELYARAAIAYLKVTPKADYAKAQAAAEKSLALDPNGELANYAEGLALAGLGKKADALAALNKASAAAKAGAGDKDLDAAVDAALKQLNSSK